LGASRFPEMLRFKNTIVSPEIVTNYLSSQGKYTKQFVTYIYFITDGEFVKIGIANNPIERLLTLQIGNARELKPLFTIPIYKRLSYFRDNYVANDLELFLHKGFGDNHIRGEWFDILHRINIDEWRQTFGCEMSHPRYAKKEAV